MPDDLALQARVRLRQLALHEAHFARVQGDLEQVVWDKVRVDFQLSLARLGQDSMGVQMGVEISPGNVFDIRVRYRATLERDRGGSAQGDDVSFWQIAVARIAPVIIFPYIRESVSSLLSKAGIVSPPMPVLNVGGIWDPESIEIPPHPFEDEG